MKLTEKTQIRAFLLNKRRNLSQETRLRLSERIVEKLKNLEGLKSAKNPVLFCPFDNEPDITPLFSYVISNKGFLILPKVVGDSLVLYKIQGMSELEKGAFCIMEPKQGQQVSPKEIDLILVPGIAFDREGYRLGFGKGYYDRLLSQIKGLKIGVCYSFQVLEFIPRDPWDVPVDLVVTEDFLIGGGKT